MSSASRPSAPRPSASRLPSPGTAVLGREGRLGVTVVLVVLACLLLAAHFVRAGEQGAVVLFLAAPLVLLLRRAWSPVAVQALLAAGLVVWVLTAADLIEVRRALGLPWGRLGLILTAVVVVTAAAAVLLGSRTVRARYDAAPGRRASAAAFVLAAGILLPVQFVVEPPGLLLERFWPTGGWFEIGILGLYAAWLTDHMLGPRSAVWRRRLWTFFSAAFFAQLALGLLGLERFLMTGTLHLPVPALIVAGPLYRGEGLFMPILFGATVLLVGPAWCSHLCYIGAWDHEFSRRRTRPLPLPPWRRGVQAGLLVAVAGGALLLASLGRPASLALWLAVGFGVVGLGVMALVSRSRGAMAHCTAYCPIGVLSTSLGRINPFRLRVAEGCTNCGACRPVCRYDSLRPEDLRAGRPGAGCTLCGDCLARCRDGHLTYRLPGLSPGAARVAFVVLVVALHAAFLGVARI